MSARHELRSPFHTGFTTAVDTPRIATSGALMIGVNAVPPMPPSDGDRERPALDVVRAELALARLAGQLRRLARDVDDALLVDVLDDRHDQTVRRVGGEADVPVVLEDQVLAVERAVHRRVLLQRRDHRLHDEGQRRHLDAALGVLLVDVRAELLELGDVGLVELSDVRDHHPVARQTRARQLLDARERLGLDRAVLGEVDLGPGRQPEIAEAATASLRRAAARERLLHERLDVLLADTALRPGAGDAGRSTRPARARSARTPGLASTIVPDAAGRAPPPEPRQAQQLRSAGSGRGSRNGGRGCRLRSRRSGRGRLGLRVAVGPVGGPALEQRQKRAGADLVANLDLHLGDDARRRRRNLQGRLVALEHQQGVVLLHRVARLDQELDDGNVLEVSDVRDGYFRCGQASLLVK